MKRTDINKPGHPVLLRPKIRVYLVLLVLVVAAMVYLHRCAGGSHVAPMPAKSGGDTLDVAIEYSPLSLYLYDDTLGGFNHDLLLLLMHSCEVPMKLHPMVSLQQSLDYLDKGIYDIIAAQVPVTGKFKERYLFSDTIWTDRQVLVQRIDSKGEKMVKTQLDLAGKTLYVAGGSPVEDRLENLGREIGDTVHVIPERKYGQEQLFLMVAEGDIDYAVVSSRVAKQLQRNHRNVDIETGISFSQFQSWVLKKENTRLRDNLNTWLRNVRKTPAYEQLYKRYFGEL